MAKRMLESSVEVNAPQARVFAVFSDFSKTAGRIKGIKRVEMLSSGPVGLGTKFRETRSMFGKETTETMEVVEFNPPVSYALGATSCGVEIRSMIRFEGAGAARTVVRFELDVTPVTLFAKIMSPITGRMMRGMMEKCIRDDLGDLKRFVEAEVGAGA